VRFNVSAPSCGRCRRWNWSPALSLAAGCASDGQRAYDESAAQLLGVWHLGPRSNLRAIVQRSRLLRPTNPACPASVTPRTSAR
jgi:hypothetical protein